MNQLFEINDCKLENLRVFQIHTFYSVYLDDLARRVVNFGSTSFNQQIDILLRDGFAHAHMFAPYLNSLGFESGLTIGNSKLVQEQWMRERGLAFPEGPNWMYQVAKLQVEEFKPDVLYLSCPTDFDSRFVRMLNWKPRLILGWRAACIPPECDFSAFDLMLSHLSGCRDKALTHGAKSVQHFFPGFPSAMAEAVRNEPKRYDVMFFGQWTREHQRRNSYLVEIARAVKSGRLNCKLAFFIPRYEHQPLPPEIEEFNHEPVWALDAHRTIKQSKICINAEIDLASKEAGNMRLFEVTGTGSFLLTEDHPNISNYFKVGEELETFTNPDELINKIQFYLEHEQERERIALAGQEKCLTEYGMPQRSCVLASIIRRRLEQKESSPNPARTETNATNVTHSTNAESQVMQHMQKAVTLFDANRADQALNELILAKALRTPVRELDYLRALVFIKLDRLLEAREALKEELRYYPDNSPARELLGKIPDRSWNELFDKDEFGEIFNTVRPYTMVDPERAYALFQLAKSVCCNGFSGNFVECGVAAGGTSAMLATIIKRYSKEPRILYSCDSFSGMPTPTEHDVHEGIEAESTGWGSGTCAAPESSVIELASRFGAQDKIVTVKGYFEDTLPQWREQIGSIALLHLDGDWYSSTLAILDNLYDQVVPNGVLQVDDYGYWDGCRKALHEFEAKRGLKFELKRVEPYGVWFQKPI